MLNSLELERMQRDRTTEDFDRLIIEYQILWQRYADACIALRELEEIKEAVLRAANRVANDGESRH